MDASAYVFAAAQGPLFGMVMETWGDPALFVAIAAACGLCVLTILFVRR